MDGQGAGGFGFVVREVISGPRELAEVAPAQAVTLACLAGSDGEGQFWCGQLEQPVKHRIGQTVDTGRYHADYLDRDEFGPFVWTYYIALQTHDAVTFSADAHSVVVDLAYVIDPSLGYDTTFDSSKVDWVATATVDGANAEVSPNRQAGGNCRNRNHSRSPRRPRRCDVPSRCYPRQLSSWPRKAPRFPASSSATLSTARSRRLAPSPEPFRSTCLDREKSRRASTPLIDFAVSARPIASRQMRCAITLWIRDEGLYGSRPLIPVKRCIGWSTT